MNDRLNPVHTPACPPEAVPASYSVRLLSPGELQADFATIWAATLGRGGMARVGERLEWAYLRGSGGPGDAWLLEWQAGNGDPVPVGIAGLLPRDFRFGKSWVRSAMHVDFAVLPEHRTLAPALLLQRARQALAHERYPFTYAVPNRQALALLKRAGHVEIGKMRRFVRILRHEPYVHRLLPVHALSVPLGALLDGASELARHARRTARRNPRRAAGREPAQGAGQSPGQATGLKSGQATGLKSGQDAGQDTGWDPWAISWQDAGRGLWRLSAPRPGQAPGSRPGHDSGRDLGRLRPHDLRSRVRLEWHSSHDERFDDLFDAAAPLFPLLGDRRQRALHARFELKPRASYETATLVERDSLRIRAYGVVETTERAAGLRDFLALTPDDLGLLLDLLCHDLARRGVPCLTVRFFGNGGVLEILESHGFVPSSRLRAAAEHLGVDPGEDDPPVLVSGNAESTDWSTVAGAPGNWYLTAADQDW